MRAYVVYIFCIFMQGTASLVRLAYQPASTATNPWAWHVNWTVYMGMSHHPTHRSVSVRRATVATPATSNVHNMAHVLMIAACVCLDSVATRASSLIVQVRTMSIWMLFFTFVSFVITMFN